MPISLSACLYRKVSVQYVGIWIYSAPTPLCPPCVGIFLARSNGAVLCGSSFSLESKVNHILLSAWGVSECQTASALWTRTRTASSQPALRVVVSRILPLSTKMTQVILLTFLEEREIVCFQKSPRFTSQCSFGYVALQIREFHVTALRVIFINILQLTLTKILCTWAWPKGLYGFLVPWMEVYEPSVSFLG